MKLHRNVAELPFFKNAVITIGTFDGVHNGHKKILEQLKTEASAIGGETVVITFHPHPRNIVGDTSGVKLLNTPEEKIKLLQQEGIDHVVIIPFDDDFANLSAEEYVTGFLYKKFKPHSLIIGYDHRFGKKRLGDYQLLETLGKQLGFVVKEIPVQVIEENTVSSTIIRKALLHHDLSVAGNLLGYDYFFEGTVIKGDQLGRTIGYPTANIQMNMEDKLVPGDGVYAVETIIKENESTIDIDQALYHINYKGMMYIGSRPVVNGKRRVIEVNMFDFDAMIYGATLQVTLKKFIRGDMHFKNLDELKRQLGKDKENTLAVLQ